MVKAKADTTVPSADDPTVDEDPPRRSIMNRKPVKFPRVNQILPSYGPGCHKGGVCHRMDALQRRIERHQLINRKVLQEPCVSSGNNKPDIPVSLNSLLVDTGLDRYIENFERQEVDSEIFLTMEDNDLIRIGIDNPQDREIILNFKNIFHTSEA